jgi:hypothetical protein
MMKFARCEQQQQQQQHCRPHWQHVSGSTKTTALTAFTAQKTAKATKRQLQQLADPLVLQVEDLGVICSQPGRQNALSIGALPRPSH